MQLMEGCWECLRVDLVKFVSICCFSSIFPWKKNMKKRDFEAPVLSPYGHVFEKDTPGPKL